MGNPIDVPGLLGSDRGVMRTPLIRDGASRRTAAHSLHARCSPWGWLLHTVAGRPSTSRVAGQLPSADETAALPGTGRPRSSRTSISPICR